MTGLPGIEAMLSKDDDVDQNYARFLRRLEEKEAACVEQAPVMDNDQITRRGQRGQQDDAAGEHQDEIAPEPEIWSCPMCGARLANLSAGRRNMYDENLQENVLHCHPCCQYKKRKPQTGDDRTPQMEAERMRYVRKDRKGDTPNK